MERDLKRRLHLVYAYTFKHSTLAADFYKGNRNNVMTLNFIPHMLKECILIEQFEEEEDIFIRIKE